MNSIEVTVPLTYPWETAENHIFFDVFRGYKKGTFTRNR